MQTETRTRLTQSKALEASVKKLLEMKDAIEEATGQVNIFKGKLQNLQDQLMSEFDCKSLSEAEKKLEKIKEKKELKEDTRDEGVEKLEDEYEWD